MPDLSGRELLEEWRGVMEAIVSSASSVAGRRELPRELLGAMQGQLALMQRVVERERLLGGELAARVLAPLDAIFDLLEQSGATLRREAEALETAGLALQDTAGLMKRQAELFEQTIGALREPAELAKAAVGLDRRASRTPGRGGARGGGAAARKRDAAKRPGGATKRPSGGAKQQRDTSKARASTPKRQARAAKR